MAETRFLVSGGDFRQDEGCLWFVTFHQEHGLRLEQELWIPHPDPALAVRGKGITGLVVEQNTAWACFSNCIVRISLPEAEILEVINDPGFNDLHQLAKTRNELIVANTGNETVDNICLEDSSISRIDLLGGELRARRPKRSRIEDTEPRLHHIVSAICDKSGQLLVGLGRQSRILNIDRWEWVGPRFPAPLHDVCCYAEGEVWCTTVDGHVHRISQGELARSWDLREHQPTVGWARGLAVTTLGLLVGTTAIRESNRDYYRMVSGLGVDRAGACLTWIPLQDGKSFCLHIPESEHRKVFSVVEI